MTSSTSTAGSSESPPSPMAWATLPTPPTARRTRPWLLAALAIAIGLLVVLGLLYASGYFSHAGSAAGSSSPWVTYAGAESAAAGAATGTVGGPWLPVFAAAFVVAHAASIPASNLTTVLSAVNCTATWTGGTAPTVSLPATPASAGVGHSGFWIVGFRNSAGELLVASVLAGNASVLLTAGGSRCMSDVLSLVEIPSSIVDSPVAVANANAAGGAAFLSEHSNVSQSWVVFGGVNFFGVAEGLQGWTIEDTTCSLPPSIDQIGASFNATEPGTSGTVTRHSTNGTVDCSLTTTTGLTLLDSPTGTAAAAAKAI